MRMETSYKKFGDQIGSSDSGGGLDGQQPGDQRLLIGSLFDRPSALLIDQEIRFFVHLPAQIHGGGGKHSSSWRPLFNYLLLNSNTDYHRPMRKYDKVCRLFE